MIPFILMTIMVAYLIISCTLQARRIQVALVVSTLASIVRQNMSLTMGLAAAGETRDSRMWVLHRIASCLETGQPLSEALRVGWKKCPPYLIAAIQAAEKVNQVPQALANLEAEIVRDSRDRNTFQPVHPAYPIAILCIAFVIVSGLMLFVIPSFQNIYKDLGMKLPWPTEALLASAALLHGPMQFLLPLFLLMIVFAIARLYVYRRPERPGAMAQLGDWIKWHSPILNWFERNYSRCRTVDVLRLSLDGGATVDQAIEAALLVDVNACFRRRLKKWLRHVQEGQDVAQAALAADVGRGFAWAFDQKVHRGVATMAILENLQSYYRSNYNYRRHLARFALWPLAVLTIACLIGSIIYALFIPYVEMLRGLVNGT